MVAPSIGIGIGISLAAMAVMGPKPLVAVDYNQISNPPVVNQLTQTSPTLAALDRTQYTATNPAQRIVGVPTIDHPTLGVGYQIPSLNSGSQAGAAWWSIEFYCNSSFVEWRTINSNSQFNISVDGQVITASQLSTTAAGSTVFIDIDWSSNPTPNKNRLYRISGFNVANGGLFIRTTGADTGATVTYPTANNLLTHVNWIGDSYPQGTGSQVDRRHVGPTVSKLLGFSHWHDGIGSTGWNSTSTNLPTTRNLNYINRTIQTPKLIVSAMGYNDQGGAGTVQANYETWFDNVRAKYPAIPVIQLGPWMPLGPTTNLTAVKNAMIAAASSKGAVFVDVQDIAFQVGGDNEHPTATGHQQLSEGIAAKLNALPIIQSLRT